MTARKPKRAKGLGVNDEQYERLLAAQGGHCAICPSTPKARRLHVDHDHASGEVRGLLCHRCNRTLATWITALWLARAISYLGGAIQPWAASKVLDEINGVGQDGKP